MAVLPRSQIPKTISAYCVNCERRRRLGISKANPHVTIHPTAGKTSVLRNHCVSSMVWQRGCPNRCGAERVCRIIKTTCG